MTTPPSNKVQQFFVDLAERVGTTFLQAFLSALLAVSTTAGAHIAGVGWFSAFMIGLLAAAVAFLSTLLLWLVKFGPLTNPYADMFYRGVVTFVQTLLGYLMAAGAVSALAFNWGTALLASAVAAGTALLKALAGTKKTSTLGASLLVKPVA